MPLLRYAAILMVPCLAACGASGEAGGNGTANSASNSATNGGTGTTGNPGIGNPPPATTINAGYQPSTISAATAQQAYNAWKGRHVKSCGQGSRVDNGAGNTFSEGIGYGMLLSVNHNDKALFDGLWSFYQANSSSSNLMNWEVNACDNSPTTRGAGPATDADLDAAMALLMASCRWGAAYEIAALSLLDAIVNTEGLQSGGLSLVKPGSWGGSAQLNLSYFAPGYFRVFAYRHAARASFWAAAADDTYVLLERGADPNTGLVPDWMTIDGTESTQGKYSYSYDAARVPWRIATDYVWYGTPAAKPYLDRVTAWANGVGIANIGDHYELDGTQLTGNHNSTFVGGFATGAMATDQAIANEFFAELARLPDMAYFEETLRALYLTLGANMFPPGC